MNKALLSGRNMKIYRPILNLPPLITSTTSTNKNIMDNSSRNFTFSFKPSEWKAAITEAEKIVGYSTSFLSLRCLLSDELSNVAVHMKKLVGTSHPLIKTAQKLFQDGKQSMQTRGLMVLLISKTAGPAMGSNLLETMVSGIYPSQRTLAEITELIHMATLVHKSVIDLCNICLTSMTLEDMEFGNKMAVLSGDFLLANASTYLASLNNTKVVEMISTAIRDIMKGEFNTFRSIKSSILNRHEHQKNMDTITTYTNNKMPLNHTPNSDEQVNESDGGSEDFVGGPKNKFKSELSMDMWEEQTYLSSGSLLAHSCQGALTLARHDPSLQTSAFQFGRSMALAYQFKEDLTKLYEPSPLDTEDNILAPAIIYANNHLKSDANFTHSNSFTDSNNGTANEFHYKDFFNRSNKEISKLILSDKLVMEESKETCRKYGLQAIEQLAPFRESSAKNALKNMIRAVINV